MRTFLLGFALVLVLRTFVMQVYGITTPSMDTTLRVGDYVVASGVGYGAYVPFTETRLPGFRSPRNGDVVVYRPVGYDPPVDVIKRVLGEPGDTLRMVERVLYRNGRRLEERYIEPTYADDEPLPAVGPHNFTWQLEALPAGATREDYRPSRDNWGPLVVPAGRYLLLGDNRDRSTDSRHLGFVTRAEIRGRVLAIYYSSDPSPTHSFPRLFTAARWHRIGRVR